MSVKLLSIGTAVPRSILPQSETRDLFIAQPGVSRLVERLIRAAFDQSAIDARYSVIGGRGQRSPEFVGADELLRNPTTRERNTIYRREAPPLTAEAAARAIEQAGVTPSDITHIITASCTGCFAPGPDFLLGKDLGIPTTAERDHLGFMGCAAAFPSLRAAARICRAEPEAIVLVACTELCSIHLQRSNDPEQIVASAIFGDGAAAAVVSATHPGHAHCASLEIHDFSTAVPADGEAGMDWTVGNHGFDMRLSAEVPKIIGREIAGVVHTMLGGADPLRSIDAWAVHPGGRSVLDRVQQGVGLPEEALRHSRAVLRHFGNMSSATVLFILRRIMCDVSLRDGARVAGLCFGPGLTVETARFTYRPHGAN